MKILDSTGREIQEGQLVDINLTGMYTAIVAQINQATGLITGNHNRPPMPPHVMVQVVVQLIAGPDGKLNHTYILGMPPGLQRPRPAPEFGESDADIIDPKPS